MACTISSSFLNSSSRPCKGKLTYDLGRTIICLCVCKAGKEYEFYFYFLFLCNCSPILGSNSHFPVKTYSCTLTARGMHRHPEARHVVPSLFCRKGKLTMCGILLMVEIVSIWRCNLIENFAKVQLKSLNSRVEYICMKRRSVSQSLFCDLYSFVPLWHQKSTILEYTASGIRTMNGIMMMFDAS